MGFCRQQIVGAGLPDGPGDGPVGGDGVDGKQRAAKPLPQASRVSRSEMEVSPLDQFAPAA